jgi:hypothetical protein
MFRSRLSSSALGLALLLVAQSECGNSLAKKSSGGPKPSAAPNVIGSGLRLHFNGQPGKTYCIVSDPCPHINVLLAGDRHVNSPRGTVITPDDEERLPHGPLISSPHQ